MPVNAIEVSISPFPQASRWAECTGGSDFWVSDDPADHGTVFLVFTSYSISNIIWFFKVPFTMPVCWYYVRRLNNTSSWTPCSGASSRCWQRPVLHRLLPSRYQGLFINLTSPHAINGWRRCICFGCHGCPRELDATALNRDFPMIYPLSLGPLM